MHWRIRAHTSHRCKPYRAEELERESPVSLAGVCSFSLLNRLRQPFTRPFKPHFRRGQSLISLFIQYTPAAQQKNRGREGENLKNLLLLATLASAERSRTEQLRYAWRALVESSSALSEPLYGWRVVPLKGVVDVHRAQQVGLPVVTSVHLTVACTTAQPLDADALFASALYSRTECAVPPNCLSVQTAH